MTTMSRKIDFFVVVESFPQVLPIMYQVSGSTIYPLLVYIGNNDKKQNKMSRKSDRRKAYYY